MRILIDADGCPVVDEAIAAARINKIECIIICDTSHEFSREGAETIIVSKGADSADFRIVNMIKDGDIVVTQDYGLAAMCLARRALAINQDGMVYDESNMDALLHQRHTSKKIRMSGGRLKGSPKRRDEQNYLFALKLKSVIENNR